MIDFLASEPQYADHLVWIYRQLPRRMRGDFYTGIDGARAGHRLWRMSIKQCRSNPSPGSRLTVVASYRDLKAARRAGRPVAFCEHGAGQSYRGTRSGSYIGASDREGAAVVLVPGVHALARQLAAHPGIPAFAIGCPKLDVHHRDKPKTLTGSPTVAISFHWDCKIAPETRSAFEHFRPALIRLSHEFELIGHAHPRIATKLKSAYHEMGIEFVEDFEDVIKRADVYAVDNSSTLFEFASLDRPVVVLNAPFFRRDVSHGMRFWEFADIGVQVDNPARLAAGVKIALDDPPETAERRREIVRQVYAHTDGTAAQNAADVLIEIAG